MGRLKYPRWSSGSSSTSSSAVPGSLSPWQFTSGDTRKTRTQRRKSLQVKKNWIPRRRFNNSSVIILVKHQNQNLVQLSSDIGKLNKRTKNYNKKSCQI